MFSHKLLFSVLALSVATASAGTHASAATLNTIVQSRGNSSFFSTDTLDGVTSHSDSINSLGIGSEASVSIDAVTGTFKALSDTSGVEDLGIEEDSIILRNLDYSANGFLLEQVTVTGQGSITFLTDYDGFWDLEGVGGFSPYFSVAIDLFIIEGTLPTPKGDPKRDGYTIGNAGNRSAPLSGSVEGTLSATTQVDGEKSFNLRSSLGTDIERGFGVVDFSNSAYLTYVTTGTVEVSFGDPLFLSGVSPDPVMPSTVPLPAGGLLLFSGLIGIAGLKRRKSDRDAVRAP